MTTPPQPPQRRNILLGVTGSIAAYKSATLIRELRRANCDVRVVMTASARAFITELTLQSLAGRPVESDAFSDADGGGMKHIDLAQWADLVLIAPASANALAKLAHGIADDLLSMVCLAARGPVAVAPAMNRQMWEHAATRANAAALRERGVLVWGPASGDQACGDLGEGRMIEPHEITRHVQALLGERALRGRKVVITAGPTREAIDPVRCLTNHSSGRMGFAMAQAARDMGADVVLVAGPVSLPTPAAVARVDVVSAHDMAAAVRRELQDADLFIACAAVSDFRPAQTQPRKIKKAAAPETLALAATEDILETAGRRHPGLFLVGFAAETHSLEANAKAKLLQKKLDIIVANRVGDGAPYGFDSDQNEVDVYWRGGGARHFGPCSKTELAAQLMECVAEQCQRRHNAQAREQGRTG